MRRLERPTSRVVAAALFAAGLTVALAGTRGDFWPFALVWFAAAVAVVALHRVLAPPFFWIAFVLSIVLLPFLAFEGGLFVLPGALAYAVATRARPGRAAARG